MDSSAIASSFLMEGMLARGAFRAEANRGGTYPDGQRAGRVILTPRAERGVAGTGQASERRSRIIRRTLGLR